MYKEYPKKKKKSIYYYKKAVAFAKEKPTRKIGSAQLNFLVINT